MSRREELREALAKLAEVCRKYQIALVGSCNTEGIYGEIEIVDLTVDKMKFADLDRRTIIEEFHHAQGVETYVERIGGDKVDA